MRQTYLNVIYGPSGNSASENQRCFTGFREELLIGDSQVPLSFFFLLHFPLRTSSSVPNITHLCLENFWN